MAGGALGRLPLRPPRRGCRLNHLDGPAPKGRVAAAARAATTTAAAAAASTCLRRLVLWPRVECPRMRLVVGRRRLRRGAALRRARQGAALLPRQCERASAGYRILRHPHQGSEVDRLGEGALG